MNKKLWIPLLWIFSAMTLCTTWMMLPELDNLNLVVKIIFGFMCSLFAYVNSPTIKKIFTTKIYHYFIEIFLVLALILLANYIGTMNTLVWDYSTAGVFTLSEKATFILKKMNKPIQIHVFDRPSGFKNIKVLLDLYKSKYKEKIEIRYVDIDIQQDLVKKFNIQQASVLNIEYGNNSLQVFPIHEKEITNALEKLSAEKKSEIAYLTGHGEKNVSELSHLQYLLGQQLLEMVPVSIQDQPLQAKTIILWGPTSSLFPGEIEIIFDAVKKGANLIIGMDPQRDQQVYKDMNEYLLQMGLFWTNGLSVDDKNHISGSKGIAPIIQYSTKANNEQKSAFFPMAGVIKIIDSARANFEIKILAQTNAFPSGYAKLDWNQILQENYSYNAQTDLQGPIPIIVSSKHKTKGWGKIVLFSNTTFVSDTFKPYEGNFSILVDVLNSFSSTTLPKEPQKRELRAPVVLSGLYINYMFILSSFVLPLCLLMMSWFWIYYRKNT